MSKYQHANAAIEQAVTAAVEEGLDREDILLALVVASIAAYRGPAVAPKPRSATAPTIVEAAQSAGTFKTLLAAAKAAGLAGALSAPGPLTVFAPTDAAFAALPKGTVESLLEPANKATLVRLLKHHVVSGASEVRITWDGAARSEQGRVIGRSSCADLAVIDLAGEDYEFLEWSQTPIALEQPVRSIGFPAGTDQLTIQPGAVSKDTVDPFVISPILPLFEHSAQIIGGNSGGPVIVDGKIVGVVMQSISKAENIGYMVPPPVIRHFLADLEEDGDYDGFPSLGVKLQDMENPTLKQKFGLSDDESGALVVRILTDSSAESVYSLKVKPWWIQP